MTNGNPFDEIRNACEKAKLQLNAADHLADTMARMLVGRLKHISPSVATELKKELKDFNCQSKVWNHKQ